LIFTAETRNTKN